MDSWIDIRRRARTLHREALEQAKGDRRANALIAGALQLRDLEVERFEPGSIAGQHVLGFLEREACLINVANNQLAEDESVIVAHEIGHFELHHDRRNEVTVTSQILSGDAIETAAAGVEGYSARERKEIQADVFAGEFLCPSDWLRDEFTQRGRKPSEIAGQLGLPLHLVTNQLIRALLLPPLRPVAEVSTTGEATQLDESQLKAATWNDGPLLVDAGPGTGKTRTLVHRIQHLLERGVAATSILALTFSKKAAEEMRERISAMNPQAAIEMWVGTFHSFGLEITAKWPSRIGRTQQFQVVDPTAALSLLEDNLIRLPLDNYQNLYEPAYDLVHILKMISRCKDEMITPEELRVAAAESLSAATDAEEQEKSEKALEVAAIYEIYETILTENDAVDFGDLIMRTARMLEENQDLRDTLQQRYKHIVVDEYQDVNFASARLLRVLSGPETKVWVVADQRQSIYRFRGAKPTNVAQFENDFCGTRQSLTFNYRSFSSIVDTFQAFSVVMAGRAMSGSWTAKRGDGGEVSVTVAPTLAAEAEAIRDKIESLRVGGIAYQDQVILARSHLSLARVTDLLEKMGVPLLYLGDLFERPEIRDLLSLVAMDAEFGGIGLVRVAQLPEYGASRQDALLVIRWSLENKMHLFEALTRLDHIPGLSTNGRLSLAKLGQQLHGFDSTTSPWTLLSTWLFERSNYLTPLLNSADIKSRQKLIAIYHFLKICGEQVALGESSRKSFLAKIRRIEMLNEDTIYRAVASEATDMDAVRVMTIHGSKGLEFRAVHLPVLATRYMPSTRQGVRCPAPQSLPHLVMQADHHEAEEECLFFVALSRARDHLSLSRAEQYTTQKSSESKFLPSIRNQAVARRHSGTGNSYASIRQLTPVPLRESYEERELELYMQCPARYDYQQREGLRGNRDESAYVRFHRCVYRTVGWLERRRHDGESATSHDALSQLALVWQTDGPVDHPFEGYYRNAAENMMQLMAQTLATENATYDRQEWSVTVANRTITLTPDRVVVGVDGAVAVQRVRTGKKTKSESEKPIYALLKLAAQSYFPGRRVGVETFYLATGERVPVASRNDEKLIQKYADAIAGIESGDFHPIPDPRRCPNCPSYFICGER